MKKRYLLLGVMLTFMSLAVGLTVHDIQYTTDPGTGTYPSPYNGQTVTLNNVIVTAVGYGTTATYPDPKFFISDPEGGPWSGIYVYRFGTGVAVGDLINITSSVTEYYGFTELQGAATVVTILSHNNPLPQPNLISTSTLSNPANPSLAEQWEGCLCKVMDVTVTQAPNQYQEFYVTDGSGEGQIDNSCYQYGHSWTGITVGRHWDQIVGIVDYAFNLYGLNPRNDQDFTEVANNEQVIILPDASLIGNFPNPFSGTTEIAYNLKKSLNVQLNVYNLKGQKVRTLVNGLKAAQLHNVTFDGKDDKGNLLPSGMYFYKLVTENYTESKKMIIR